MMRFIVEIIFSDFPIGGLWWVIVPLALPRHELAREASFGRPSALRELGRFWSASGLAGETLGGQPSAGSHQDQMTGS
jgi:hypothetical protein